VTARAGSGLLSFTLETPGERASWAVPVALREPVARDGLFLALGASQGALALALARLLEASLPLRARVSGPEPGRRVLQGGAGAREALLRGVRDGSVQTLTATLSAPFQGTLQASLDGASGVASLCLRAPRIPGLHGLLAELVTRHEGALQALAGRWTGPLPLWAPCAEERARGVAQLPGDAQWFAQFLRCEGAVGYCRRRWWVGEETREATARREDWLRWRALGVLSE
jgi:hypothetical protein